MTRTTNARVAGFAFLFYIATGLSALVLEGRATAGEGVAARLASIAKDTAALRLAALLVLAGCVCALVLAVTLYAITRDVDPDLALAVLVFRTAEGIGGAVLALPGTLGRLWLATSSPPDPAAAAAIGAMLFTLPSRSATLTATFFAIGSLVFTWLLLRGRLVPAWMAWLGFVASILLVLGLPLTLVGALRGPVTQLMWIPMAAFEIPLGVWMLIKGVRAPGPVAQPARA
jgi:hypothetical protein